MNKIGKLLLLITSLFLATTASGVSDIFMLTGPNGEKVLLFGDNHFPNPSPDSIVVDTHHMKHFFDVEEQIVSKKGFVPLQCTYEGGADVDQSQIHATFSALVNKKEWHQENPANPMKLTGADGRDFIAVMILQDFFGIFDHLQKRAQNLNVHITEINVGDDQLSAIDLIKQIISKRDIFTQNRSYIDNPKYFINAIAGKIYEMSNEISNFHGHPALKDYLIRSVANLINKYEALREEFIFASQLQPDFNTIDTLFAMTVSRGYDVAFRTFHQDFSWAAADIFFLHKTAMGLDKPQMMILGSVHTRYVANTLMQLGFQGQHLAIAVTEKGVEASLLEQTQFIVGLTESLCWIHSSPNEVLALNYCHVCATTKSKVGSGLQKCSRCKTAFYCSTECQRKDWGTHKNVCKPQAK